MWLDGSISRQYVTDKIFFDLRTEVLLAGVFDVRNGYIFVLKRHVFLGPYPSVFLLFAWYICTHSLHYYFFCHCAFLSCFLAFSLGLLNSSIPPPLRQFDEWLCPPYVKRAHGFMGVICLEAWGGFGSGSARPREQFTFNFTSNESRSPHGRALPLTLFCILFSEFSQF